jgi:hypothetical protein
MDRAFRVGSLAVRATVIGAAALSSLVRAQAPQADADSTLAPANQPIARAPLPLDPEVAARPHVQCDLIPEFLPRSLWSTTLWPGGNVYYEFDANVTQPNRDAMRLAMDELETVAHIAFIPRTSQSNYIHAQDSTGNNSLIGMSGGAQTVNIYNWNVQYIMEHELMHALGLWHEQSRSDRATYVTVNYANIQTAYSHNFDIQPGASPFGAFDFESIMLYDACAFSTCCPAGFTCGCATSCAAMQALPAYAQYQSVMGNRSYLSTGDKAGLANRYGAPVDDLYEPNNTVATARPLAAGTYNLRLVDPDDFFSITVSSTSTLTISDTHPEADVDITLSLATSAGTVLQTSNTATGTDTITRTVAAGTYIIHVQRSARWGGQYTLSIAGCSPPAVSTQPAPALACLGGSFSFSGAATDAGSAPFTFQWFKDGALIPNAGRFVITPAANGRSSTLAVSGTTSNDVGQYWFTAANGCSPAQSSPATLALTNPPTASFTAALPRPCRWGTQTYTANPGAGAGGFTYRWQVADDANRTNWHDLIDGPQTIAGVPSMLIVTGAASQVMSLSDLSVRGTSVADFRVIATGSCGPSTSASQSLYVCGADFDCNGTIAVQDIFAYLNAWFINDQRTDNNGLPGLQVSDIFGFMSMWFTGCP